MWEMEVQLRVVALVPQQEILLQAGVKHLQDRPANWDMLPDRRSSLSGVGWTCNQRGQGAGSCDITRPALKLARNLRCKWIVSLAGKDRVQACEADFALELAGERDLECSSLVAVRPERLEDLIDSLEEEGPEVVEWAEASDLVGHTVGVTQWKVGVTLMAP